MWSYLNMKRANHVESCPKIMCGFLWFQSFPSTKNEILVCVSMFARRDWIITELICTASWLNQQYGCAPSEDSDQPGHPPSQIRVFAVRMKKARVLSYPLSAQWRLWSDWADAQAVLSLRWAHNNIVGFVTRRLVLLKQLKDLFIPC